MHSQDNYHIIEKVPVNYYQNGIKNNFFQRYWHTKKLNEVIGFIEGNPKEILDVGCASGWFLHELSKKIPSAKFYGVDIYKEGIDYAKKEYPNINFYVSNAEKLRFEDSKFDLIINTEVIEHLENPEKAINEMKRVLKKNGRLIIEVDSGSLLFSIVWYLWRKFNGKVWNESHLHSFNVNKLEKVAKKAGFKILKKRKFNFGMAMVFLLEK